MEEEGEREGEREGEGKNDEESEDDEMRSVCGWSQPSSSSLALAGGVSVSNRSRSPSETPEP